MATAKTWTRYAIFTPEGQLTRAIGTPAIAAIHAGSVLFDMPIEELEASGYTVRRIKIEVDDVE